MDLYLGKNQEGGKIFQSSQPCSNLQDNKRVIRPFRCKYGVIPLKGHKMILKNRKRHSRQGAFHLAKHFGSTCSNANGTRGSAEKFLEQTDNLQKLSTFPVSTVWNAGRYRSTCNKFPFFAARVHRITTWHCRHKGCLPYHQKKKMEISVGMLMERLI